MISCQALSKSYEDGSHRVTVLRDLSLNVPAGEMLAIVGASGSGKTTLLHLLGGLDKPSSGKLYINEQEVSAMSSSALNQFRNRDLGFIFQFHHLLPEFSALENVMMPLLLRGDQKSTAQAQALELLEQVGLKERVRFSIAKLSGGERQRVAIARALVTRPKLVLADEPTGNLDQDTAETVFQLLQRLSRSLNTAIVLVTHNLELAGRCDRCLLLEQGQLIDKGNCVD